jgi:pyruvate kinase
VIAIVAGTRTKSGSTNFLRLHVMGEHSLEGVRFFTTHEEEQAAAPGTSKVKHAPTKHEKAPVKPR